MAKVADVYSPTIELSAALRKQLRTSDVLWMPNRIIADTKLTPGAKFLYSVLLNQSWREAVVNRSHSTLAREIGASVRATRNYIDELKRAKLIALQTRPGKPSLYTVARH
jgi:hypothetical protein